MLIQRSRLDAATLERPRLIAPWVLALLTSLTLLALIAIYPFKVLVDKVVATTRGDPLTTSYLHNLLRTDPENPELRLTLARQQFAAGQLEESQRTLEPALQANNPELRQDALWLAWRIRVREAEAPRLTGAEREQRRAALAVELRRIAGERWPDNVLIDLARNALMLNQTDLAIDLYERAAESGGRDPAWYASAAGVALGNGEYRVAGRLFLVARERSTTLAQRRGHFLSALRALQSGNLLPDAMETAQRELGDLAQDQETLVALVELALASNRLDLADRYVRALLRLSLLEQYRRAALAAQGLDGTIRPVADVVPPPGGPRLPFDDRIYSLGFEVFLANRKLEDAYRVAASAVRQAPEDIAWRKRLAQVSEWTTRPKEALEHWLILAQRTGSDEAWQAVLRLAPGLFDDRALLAALERELARGSTDPKLPERVVAAYERLGEAEAGLAFLERLYAQRPAPALLEIMARLAERAGAPDKALGLWERLLAVEDITTQRAIHVAGLLLIRGRMHDAFVLLDHARQAARDGDTEFWRTYAELALRLQEDERAIAAYRKIMATQDATEADYQVAIDLLAQPFPAQAAELARAAWERWGRQGFLLRALNLLAGAARWQEMQHLLAAMTPAQRGAAENEVEFLRLRAQLRQHSGRQALAGRDLERALALQPDAHGLRESLLWLLIDAYDPSALRAALARWEPRWRTDAAMHDTLAAAYLALSEPQAALEYLAPRVRDRRGDFLWMMTYADALEQNQQADRAWRLRELLWRERRARAGAIGAAELDAAQRMAQARLAVARDPGDAALAVIRELVRADRESPATGKLSPQVAELVLAWMQSAGEYAAQRGFLWQQYGRNLTRPLWAEITAALQTDDLIDIGALLERHGERLPRYDWVSAAQRSSDLRLAQSAAFDKQARQPDDDPLHFQLTENLLAYADRFDFSATDRRLGALGETQRGVELEIGAAPDLRLGLSADRLSRRSRDQSLVYGVPASEDAGQARLTWRHRDGETVLGVGSRRPRQAPTGDALQADWARSGLDRAAIEDLFRRIGDAPFAAYAPVRFEHRRRLSERAGVAVELGRHLPATETAQLRSAGMKDEAALGLQYRVSRYDRLSGRWSAQRYLLQRGERVGRGLQWSIEATHTLRTELPDLELSGFLTGFRFRARTELDAAGLAWLTPPALVAQAAAVDPDAAAVLLADAFVPRNYTNLGLRVSTGMLVRSEYTRALRPFAAAGLNRNSVSGNGYSLLAGIAGSIIGSDHFQIAFQLDKGGSGAFDRTREAGFSYRLYF